MIYSYHHPIVQPRESMPSAFKPIYLVSAAAALAFAPAAFAQGNLTGTVSDAYTGARIEGAIVSVAATGATATSDGAGQFSIACQAPMTMLVTRVGYQNTQRAVSDCSTAVQILMIPGAQSLSGVNVVAEAPQEPIVESQGSATLRPLELQRTSGLSIHDAVNMTPGIRMQTRTMFGGQTFTIRGYGFGDDATNMSARGFKAYLNDIPLTDAEGTTMMDDVDWASLGRVDIIRGPASSLYGPGIGGVVNLYTAVPHELGTTLRQETTGGQYGLLRSTTRFQHVSSSATTSLSYGRQTYDSYRVASNSDKNFVTFYGDFRPSDRQSITTFVSYSHSYDLRAGELDSAKFAQKLNVGEDSYILNRARSKVEGFRAGVTHRYDLGHGIENKTTAFMTGTTNEDAFAAGLNLKSGQTFGARSVFTTKLTAGDLPLTGTSGVEYEQTNAATSALAMSKSIVSKLNSNLRTTTMQSNIFTQWDAALPSGVTVTAGASVNFVAYGIRDLMTMTSDPKHLNAGGRNVFDPVVTPRVAVRKDLGGNTFVYANVSQGYSPPTAGDAVIPYTGKANTGLKPERATQYEIGAKGGAFSNRLQYQASLFDLRVSDKLTSQSVDSAGISLYSFRTNAGDQDDRGLELAASYALVDKPTGWLATLRPFASYTYSDFTYRNFKSDNNNNAKTIDYSGKNVVGVAPNTYNMGIDVSTTAGAYAHVTYHHVDALPISYDNAHKAVAFSLVGAKVGVTRTVGSFLVDIFAGGDNLTNALYYTQVFVNHKFIPGAVPPNMYLPGPYKAVFYGGLNLSFRP